MSGHDDEGRQLGRLLREITPEFRPVDLAMLSAGGTRRRMNIILAVCAVVLVTIGVAVTVAVTDHATSRPDAASSHHSGAGPSTHPTQSLRGTGPELSATRADALAKDAPCQSPDSVPKLADRSSIAKLRPIAVVECEYDNLAIKGNGTWAVLIRQVSVTDLASLQARFSQPNDTTPLPSNTVCGAVGHAPVPFYFADGNGHYLRPRTPSDTCGDPLPNIASAVAAIQWRTVSITKLHRAEADAESTNPNACQNDTQSAVQQAHATDPSAKATFIDQPAGKLTACIYYSLDDSGDGRGSRLLYLTPGYFQPVVAALSGPPPTTDRRCPAQNSFAVIHDTHGRTLTVELGGCWRVATSTPQPVIVGTAAPKRLTALLAPTTTGIR